MRPLYSVAGIALTPALAHWLKRRAARGREDASRIRERFGHASVPRPPGTLVWLHAASVGEVQSVLRLVQCLLRDHPALQILITTGTVTSAALIAQQQLPRVIHQFVPVDTQPAVRRFLAYWQPHLALWVESELWPQLLWNTHDRAIPMLLLNGRMSARSARGWQRWPRVIRSLLACFTALYAGTAEDAARLTALGGTAVRDVGNLKYDAAPLAVDDAQLSALMAMTTGRPLWLAASTHANEEQLVGDVHRLLAPDFTGLITLLVPRHASRGDSIAADLRARGLTVTQRSKGEAITPDTDIYLADTMGELGSFYRLSEMVFIGGSLVPHGGQNPLEPARLGSAIITGPYTHNFASIIAHLNAAEAIRIVADTPALADAVRHLMRNPEERQALAARAQAVVAQAHGATEVVLQQVAQMLAGAHA